MVGQMLKTRYKIPNGRAINALMAGYIGTAAQITVDIFNLSSSEMDKVFHTPGTNNVDVMFNLKRNEEAFKKSRLRFKDIMKYKRNTDTLAICGAGPSLDYHLAEIRDRNLLTVGINKGAIIGNTDIILVADRLVPASWLDKIKTRNKVLFTCPSANFEITNLPWKERYIFKTRLESMPWKYRHVYSRNIVLSTGIHIAYLLGFKKIELYGCDFAYKPGKYYSGEKQHTDDKIFWPSQEGAPYTVTGVDGEEWITNRQFYNHSRNIIALCNLAQNSGYIDIINKSSGIFWFGKRNH